MNIFAKHIYSIINILRVSNVDVPKKMLLNSINILRVYDKEEWKQNFRRIETGKLKFLSDT